MMPKKKKRSLRRQIKPAKTDFAVLKQRSFVSLKTAQFFP